LWRHRSRSRWVGDDDPIWATTTGTLPDYGNLTTRVLVPAREAAGMPWVTRHTLRRTCATLLVVEHGFLPNQVQTWIGHEDPVITLALYTELTSDDLPRVDWTRSAVQTPSTTPPEPVIPIRKRA
jgi:integrase